VIGDRDGMDSLISRLQNESERREHTIVEKSMNVQIGFYDFVSGTFCGRPNLRVVDERAGCDSDQY
jgi:hypothetical protein